MTSSGLPAEEPGGVAGVVLAAGESRRMGRPKAYLEISGETFVERAVRVLGAGGCRDVIVVVGGEADPIGRLAALAAAVVLRNPDPASEQVDSLRLALRQVDPEVGAVALLPVDCPLVRPGTVARLVSAWRGGDAQVVRPVHRGRAGHPTLLGRRLFPEILSAPLPEGARSLIAAHAADVLDVPVEDPGVLADVDTPEDYLRLVEGT